MKLNLNRNVVVLFFRWVAPLLVLCCAGYFVYAMGTQEKPERKSTLEDGIVLIDFINRRVADGLSLNDAIMDAGRRRCRPVLFTSLTTIGGMLPILLETSRQAQVLIPMATSLSFGLIFGTALVRILAPVGCYILGESRGGDAANAIRKGLASKPGLSASEPS